MDNYTSEDPKAGQYWLVPAFDAKILVLYYFTDAYNTKDLAPWIRMWLSTGDIASHHLVPWAGIQNFRNVIDGGTLISEEKAKMLISLWRKRE